MTLKTAESRNSIMDVLSVCSPEQTQSCPLGRQDRITATAEAEAIAALTMVLGK